ncbi:DNA polymerase III subunit delta [Pelosinus sp. IPA-1]|uniref:DNA polymerase III subunit delta n=1 Tax=Pelosinus sp. IPA-1 TaxID=3029569 RepID=UPI0024362546|nr:DNA polymerase III subunit delta [Pelosinus sp. IPA-1]GMB00802.1 DNA polymerase III subunit delta [Pelosinus sp. IPA-1]
MSYAAVLEEIKKGQVKSIYLLHGEETYFIRQIEQAVIKAVLAPEEIEMNLLHLEKDPTINEFIALIETVPFMGGKNVIVVRGTSLFRPRKTGSNEQAETGDKLDERLLNVISNMPDYTHVILSTTDKVDKRRKLFKIIEKHGAAVEVANLKGKDVRGWLLPKLNELNRRMASDAMEYFLGVISIMPQVSLGFLENELEKVALFTEGKSVISHRDLVEIMSSIPEISIFSMIDAVSQKQLGKALQLLGEQVKSGEHPLKLLSLLARQVRLMWQAREMEKDGRSTKEISEKLGVMPFIGEKMLKQSQNFRLEALKEATLALATADYDLKSGRANHSVIEQIIIALCR